MEFPVIQTFQRGVADWLRKALTIDGAQVPRAIDTDVLRASLEVMQGGFPLSSWETLSAGFGGNVVICKASIDEIVILRSLSIYGVTAAGTWGFHLEPPTGAWADLVYASALAIGANESMAQKGYPFVVVPPGWQAVVHNAGGLLASFTSSFQRAPAGSKPI